MTKTFGNVVAVDDLSIKVEKGEIYGLLGTNGAGKTTTMKVFACLLKPTGGTARFFSGLGVKDFVKSSHIISYSRRALSGSAGWVKELTELEKMQQHWESVGIRCE